MNSEVITGYRAGLLGWCVAEHARYYSAHWGFGVFFETKVATEMADFLRRLQDAGNHLFSAADDTDFLATVTLDGGDAQEGLAHLRWFIASNRARGQGLGRRLLDKCLYTARADGADGVYLTTFAGLDAARRLYEDAGFALVTEAEDATWGRVVHEQRFEVRF